MKIDCTQHKISYREISRKITEKRREIKSIEDKISQKNSTRNQIIEILKKNAHEIALAAAGGCIKGVVAGPAGCLASGAIEALKSSLLAVAQNYRTEKSQVERKISQLESDGSMLKEYLRALKNEYGKIDREIQNCS
ncbi:MAG: hypothetical protein ACTSXV_00610 [Alphaproteobacteria bacterium]